MMRTLLLVDDHPMFRRGVKELITRQCNLFDLVIEADDGNRFDGVAGLFKNFPPSCIGDRFAGLKSAVLRAHESGQHEDADIAASFQQAALDCIIDRTRIALRDMEDVTALVVAGGVASNQVIRAGLEQLASEFALPFTAPPLPLCTDNAAMIAWAGMERLVGGFPADPLDLKARPRWPLDPDAAPARGAGVKA